jgi:hypothetical protein
MHLSVIDPHIPQPFEIEQYFDRAISSACQQRCAVFRMRVPRRASHRRFHVDHDIAISAVLHRELNIILDDIRSSDRGSVAR